MAVKQLFANNASSLLAASIDDIETTIQVDSGYGALFPNPGADEYFVIALENSAGDIEICKCTSRSTDLLTVVRGWESTTAQAWTNGVTRVECRNTKGSMQRMIQRGGDVMEGDLNMDSFEIQNASLTGTTTITEATIVGGVLQNSNGNSGNQIIIPDDPTENPTVGGSPIMTEASFDPMSVFPLGMIVLWWGTVANIPSGWALCDGRDGRPDLRNKFVVGAGSTYALGDTGGDTSKTTTGTGNHAHTETGSTVLTGDTIPYHNHELYVWEGTPERGYAEGFAEAGQGYAIGVAGNGNTSGGFTYDFRNLNYLDQELVSYAGVEGEANGHTHTISEGGSHTHTVDVLPPYIGIYYIIKVDPAGDYGGVGGTTPASDMYDMYNEDGCTTHIGGQSTLMQRVFLTGADMYSMSLQINCCESNVHKVTLTDNATILAPNNPLSGQVINIILKQGTGGNKTVTWDAVFKFPGGTPPTLSTAEGAIDIITCQYDSDDLQWYCNMTANYS